MAQLARLKALRDEVLRPTRRELKAMAAEVRADETLARLRAARDRLDRVDAQVRMWRRNAGRRTPLPQVLVTARDESFNAYTQAYTAARAMVAAVEAVQPRLSRAELAGLRASVHAATSRPGGPAGSRLSSGVMHLADNGRNGTPARSETLDPVPARWPGWQAEYRRISNLIHEQDSLVASAGDAVGRRQHLAEAARLRALAVSVRTGGGG